MFLLDDPVKLTVLVVIAALAVYVFGLGPAALRFFGVGVSKARSLVTKEPAAVKGASKAPAASAEYAGLGSYSSLLDSDPSQPTPAEAFEAVCVLHRRMHACQVPKETCKRVCDEITSLILFHGDESSAVVAPVAAPAVTGGAA